MNATIRTQQFWHVINPWIILIINMQYQITRSSKIFCSNWSSIFKCRSKKVIYFAAKIVREENLRVDYPEHAFIYPLAVSICGKNVSTWRVKALNLSCEMAQFAKRVSRKYASLLSNFQTCCNSLAKSFVWLEFCCIWVSKITLEWLCSSAMLYVVTGRYFAIRTSLVSG